MGRETVEVPVKIIEEILNTPIEYKIRHQSIAGKMLPAGNYTTGYFVNVSYAEILEDLLNTRGGE